MQVDKLQGKHKELLDCLESAKQILKGTTLEQRQLNYVSRRKPFKETIKKSQREQSGDLNMFRRPKELLVKRIHTSYAPEYQKHPEKWTKYSLKDTDTSECANSRAAFEFLKDMEFRKQFKSQEDEASGQKNNSRTKIQFNRTSLKSTMKERETDTCGIFKGSKVIMPEYVVGHTDCRGRKEKRSVAINMGSQLKLDHLFEIDM